MVAELKAKQVFGLYSE